MTLSPYYEFFGHAVDAEMELSLLREFSTRIHALLLEAAEHAPEDAAEAPDVLEAVAETPKYLYGEVFPDVLHESFLITCVVFLEREIRSVVDILRKVTGTPLTFSDISGSNLERFRTFCRKVCAFDPKLSECQWQSLAGLIEVRNCLVHSSGFLDGFPKRKAIEAFCRRNPAFVIHEHRLVMSEGTSTRVLEILSDFVETVFRAGTEKYPREP